MMNFLKILIETSITMGIITLIILIALPYLDKKYSPKTIYYSLVMIAVGYLLIFRPQMPSSMITVPLPVNSYYRDLVINKPTIYPSDSMNVQIDWNQLILSLWLLGATICASIILYKHIKFSHFIRRWGYESTEEQRLSLRNASKSLKIISTPKLIICPAINTPLLIGIIKNSIILPEKELDNKELELILIHELIHLKKRDILIKILLAIVLSIHWFNPIIWIFVKVVLFYCETSCDYSVTMNMTFDDRHYYGGIILKSIKDSRKVNTLLSSQFNGGNQTMKKRLESIINSTPKKIGVSFLAGVAFISLCAGMIFTFQIKSNATAKKPTEKEMNYSLGKSEEYKLLEQLAALDKNISVKEYNNKINAIYANNNIDNNQFLSNSISSISMNDPLYDFLFTTLFYSSSELYSDTVGNELPTISTNATMYFPEELSPEVLEELKNELSSEEYEDFLNGDMNSDQSYNLDYHITYGINNPSTLTVIERDDILNSIISDVQEKIETFDRSELDNNPKDVLKLFLKELAIKYSNHNIHIECSYDDFF